MEGQGHTGTSVSRRMFPGTFDVSPQTFEKALVNEDPVSREVINQLYSSS